MEILDKINNNIENCIMTIGNFDGLHLGHIKIIEFINKIAAKKSSKSLLITFNPHPFQILHKTPIDYLITSFNKKIDLLNSLEVDFVYVVDFDKEFANIKADDFIRFFLHKKFKPTDIVVGYDHFFGKNRKGSFELLAQYKDEFSYDLHKVDKIKINNFDVKSSIIRDFIRDGKIKQANNLLGRRFSFYGKVVHGEGIGAQLSFPTANIQVQDKLQLLPKDGVYYTEIFIKNNNKKYNSVCNIGVRPTFNDNRQGKTIEVHIFDNEEFDIYNYEIELIFKEHIRDEIKFNDKKELINQINLDKEYCINN